MPWLLSILGKAVFGPDHTITLDNEKAGTCSHRGKAIRMLGTTAAACCLATTINSDDVHSSAFDSRLDLSKNSSHA